VQDRELPLAPAGLAFVRLLIDANLSPKVARALGKSGLEAVHVGDVGLLTASDRSLLDYAAANDLVIVSADSDFGETLAASRGATRPFLTQTLPDTTLARAEPPNLRRYSRMPRTGTGPPDSAGRR
jgi:hypothetical protein